jgi:hypothetical protein
MAIVSIQQLYQDFKDGNVITEPNLVDLIDSCYNYDMGNGGTVYELNLTLKANDLMNMSYREGTTPYTGMEVLPAPGKGKCYVPAYRTLFASYEVDGEAYIAAPYGSFVSLDFYYPRSGYNSKEPKGTTIAAIPLASDPYSTWCNRCLGPCVDTDQHWAKWSGLESLNITSLANSSVAIPWSDLNTKGLSLDSLDNSPLYLATSRFINKARSNTNGVVKVKMWYRIFDISELRKDAPCSLEDVTQNNPYSSISWDSEKNKGTVGFSQNPIWTDLQKPTFADYDNFPGNRSTPQSDCAPEQIPSSFDFGTAASTYRQIRDSLYKQFTELGLQLQVGLEDLECFMWPEDPNYDTNKNSYIDLPTLQTSGPFAFNQPIGGIAGFSAVYPGKIPTIFTPTIGKFSPVSWGWPHDEIFIKTRLISELTYGDSTLQGKSVTGWYPDPDQFNLGAETLVYVEDSGTYSDGTCKRVTGFTITNGGTNYLVGDNVPVTDIVGGVGQGCTAEVSEVDPGTGEILAIEVTPDSVGISGGQYYQAGATVDMTGSGDGNATVQPILEVGQWILYDTYKIGLTDNAGTYLITYDDIVSVSISQTGPEVKAFNEICLSCGPYWSSGDIPRFNVKKYLL